MWKLEILSLGGPGPTVSFWLKLQNANTDIMSILNKTEEKKTQIMSLTL